jgi:hypothetical protein
MHRRREILLDCALFILGGLVILVPARFPTDWDACQFVLGLNRFSIPDQQPHPAGYVFFLWAAGALRYFGADPHRALVATSVLAAALIPVAVRRLTAKLYVGRPDIAIGAGLLALAAPARLFYGAQALTYTWEGLLSTLLVSFALDIDPGRSGGNRPIAWILWAALLGIAGGFRPNLLLFFLPVAILLALRRRWPQNLIAPLVLCAVTAVWIVPAAEASGGLGRFLQALRGQGAFYTYAGMSPGRVIDDARGLIDTWGALTGLHAGWWIVVGLAGWILGRGRLGEEKAGRDAGGTAGWKPALRLMLWFAMPMAVFQLFTYYTIRYSLLYLPVLLPLSAGLAARLVDAIAEKTRSARAIDAARRVPWGGLILPGALLVVSWVAFLTGYSAHSLGHLRSLENETMRVVGTVSELGKPENVTLVAGGRRFRIWGMAMPQHVTYYPMHAFFASEFNPRLAEMFERDTVRGDFFMPDAPNQEQVVLSASGEPGEDRVVVLDEDSFRVLRGGKEDWTAVRITSRENIYWKRFPGGCVLVDTPEGISLVD